MPVALVKKYAKKAGISVEKAEEKWERAKSQAEGKFKHGSKSYWPYVVGTFKKMMGESEQVSLSDFILIEPLAEQKNRPGDKDYGTIKGAPKHQMLADGIYMQLIDRSDTAVKYRIGRLMGGTIGEFTASRQGAGDGLWELKLLPEHAPVENGFLRARETFLTSSAVVFRSLSWKWWVENVLRKKGIISGEQNG
jgi:hypothetical protein